MNKFRHMALVAKRSARFYETVDRLDGMNAAWPPLE